MDYLIEARKFIQRARQADVPEVGQPQWGRIILTHSLARANTPGEAVGRSCRSASTATTRSDRCKPEFSIAGGSIATRTSMRPAETMLPASSRRSNQRVCLEARAQRSRLPLSRRAASERPARFPVFRRGTPGSSLDCRDGSGIQTPHHPRVAPCRRCETDARSDGSGLSESGLRTPCARRQYPSARNALRTTSSPDSPILTELPCPSMTERNLSATGHGAGTTPVIGIAPGSTQATAM